MNNIAELTKRLNEFLKQLLANIASHTGVIIDDRGLSLDWINNVTSHYRFLVNAISKLKQHRLKHEAELKRLRAELKKTLLSYSNLGTKKDSKNKCGP